MKKSFKLVFITLLSILSNSFGQEAQELEDFSIKGSSTIGGRSIIFSDLPVKISIKDKYLDFFAIALKISKKNDEDLDINKFYLVDHKNKIRYRLVDCLGINFGKGGIKHTTVRAWENEEHNVLNIGGTNERVFYNPEMHDSFKDYAIQDYTDISNTLDFGTKKNPMITQVYYSPVSYKKNLTFYMRFAVKRHEPNQEFQLYYGYHKVLNIIRKKYKEKKD